MKTHSVFAILFSGLVLTLPGRASAQITVTSFDMPMANNIIYTSFDTVTSSLSRLGRPASGANVTWNYGFLPTTYKDTDALVIPPLTPYADKFPSATMADSSYGTPGYAYHINTDSAYSTAGTVQQPVAGANAVALFSPPFLQVKLPAHYGGVDSGTSTGNIPAFHVTGYPGIDSGRGTLTIIYRDTINGYGTITTPLSGGTKYNVLCQKKYAIEILDIYIYEGTPFNQWIPYQSTEQKAYLYTWYANGVGYPVVTMSMDSTNTHVKSVQWYTGYITGINELGQQQNVLVYPNPCTSQITFRYSREDAQNIFAYDITGRQLGQAEIKNGTGRLNTSGYSAGMYFYRITDRWGNLLDNGKFIVL